MNADSKPTEDLMQKILNETELSQTDQQRQSTAETLEDERLTPQKLEKQFSRRLSELDSLEREMDSEYEKIEKILAAINEREDEDEFERNHRKNAVDSGDYDRVRQALDRMREQFVPKLVLRDQLEFPTMMQLRDLVDRQQWAHDGERIVEQTQDIAEMFGDRTETLLEMQRDFQQQQTEKIVTAVEQVQQQQVAVQELLDVVIRVQDAVAAVDADSDELAALHDELRDLQQTLEDRQAAGNQNDATGNGSALSDTERRIVSLLEDDPELSDTELAQKVSVKKDRVSELRDELEQRGIVDPR